jgi:hypothetical protein
MDPKKPVNSAVTVAVKSVGVGLIFPILLALIAVMTANFAWLSWVSKIAIFFLAPGILLGFETVQGREHDADFWLWTVLIDVLIYALLAAAFYIVVPMIRTSRSNNQGE